jgi:hypothetical protein
MDPKLQGEINHQLAHMGAQDDAEPTLCIWAVDRS